MFTFFFHFTVLFDVFFLFFFFNHPATTEIYTLSLHDALPISIRLEPRNAEAHSNLGGILMQRGRTDEAVEEYRRALELQPLPEIVLNYARALDAGGRRAEAIAYYQRFLEEAGRRFPEHAEIVKSRIARLRAPQDADR